MQNRKYPFQFQRINASSPLWPGRTAVYLIKDPDSDGPKIHVLFRDPLAVDPVDVRPDVGDQALYAMLVMRSPHHERQICRYPRQQDHHLFRRHVNSLRIPRGRGNLLIERIFIFSSNDRCIGKCIGHFLCFCFISLSAVTIAE